MDQIGYNSYNIVINLKGYTKGKTCTTLAVMPILLYYNLLYSYIAM